MSQKGKKLPGKIKESVSPKPTGLRKPIIPNERTPLETPKLNRNQIEFIEPTSILTKQELKKIIVSEIFELPEAKITGFEYKLYTEEQVKEIAVIEVSLNPAKDGGLSKTVFDPRLGVNTPSDICATCKRQANGCPGHYGYIDLAKPVYRPGMISIITKVLQSVCNSCSELLMTEDNLKELRLHEKSLDERLKTISEYSVHIPCRNQKNSEEMKTKGIKLCNQNPVFARGKSQNLNQIMVQLAKDKQMPLDIVEVYKILSNITEESARHLGFYGTHPKALVIKKLLVTPLNNRIPWISKSNKEVKDPLSAKYINIITKNNIVKSDLLSNYANEVRNPKADTAYGDIVKFIGSIFEEKEKVGSSASTNEGKSVMEALRGKQGVPRSLMLGKRLNNTARAVVVPATNIRVNEANIPKAFASILVVEETVTIYNRESLQKLLKDGFVDAVISEGIYKKILEKTRKNHILKLYDIVYRHTRNGDYNFLNRQPTLHKEGHMSHKMVLWDSGSIGLHLSTTNAYKADFDGDEMNIIGTTNIGSRVEMKYISSVTQCLMDAQQSHPMLGSFIDSPVLALLMTESDVVVEEATYQQLLQSLIVKDQLASFDERIKKSGYSVNFTELSRNLDNHIEASMYPYYRMLLKKYENRNLYQNFSDIAKRYLSRNKKDISDINWRLISLGHDPMSDEIRGTIDFLNMIDSHTSILEYSNEEDFFSDPTVPQELKDDLRSFIDEIRTVEYPEDSDLTQYYLDEHGLGLILDNLNPELHTVNTYNYFFNNDKSIKPPIISDGMKKMLQDYNAISALNTAFSQYSTEIVEVPKYGRVLFSALLPEDFYYSRKKKETEKEDILIRNGILITGTINSSDISLSQSSIVAKLFYYYSAQRAVDFLSDLTFLASAWGINVGFTTGIKDCIPNFPGQEELVAEEIKKLNLQINLLGQTGSDPVEQELRQKKIKQYISTAQNNIQNQVLKHVTEDNGLDLMIRAGTKGKKSDQGRMMGLLGIQTIAGDLLETTITEGQRLSIYAPMGGPVDAENIGFVKNSFSQGLSPKEFIFTQTSGRKGIVEKAIEVTDVGVVRRKLVKVLEDIIVGVDTSIRKNSNNIIYQEIYGGDGFSPKEVSIISTPYGKMHSFIDFNYVTDQLNSEYDIYIEKKISGDIQINELLKNVPFDQISDSTDPIEILQYEYSNKIREKIIQKLTTVLGNKNSTVDDLRNIIPSVEDYLNPVLKYKAEFPGLKLNYLKKLRLYLHVLAKNLYSSADSLPRKLKPSEITEILSHLPHIQASNSFTQKSADESLRQSLYDQLTTIKITPLAIPQLIDQMIWRFNRAKIEYGSTVGVLAAEALSGPITQLSFASIRRSGTEAPVDLRFMEEILNVSVTRKNERVRVHFLNKNYTTEDIFIKKKEFVEIVLNDLIKDYVTEKISQLEMPENLILKSDGSETLVNHKFWRDTYCSVMNLDIDYDKNFYCLRLYLNTDKMYSYRITMNDIVKIIEENNSLICIASPFYIGIIDVHIKQHAIQSICKNISKTEDSYKHLQFCYSTVIIPELKQKYISGIPGIKLLYPNEFKILGVIEREQKISENNWSIYLSKVRMHKSGITPSMIFNLFRLSELSPRYEEDNKYMINVISEKSPIEKINDKIAIDEKSIKEEKKTALEKGLKITPRKSAFLLAATYTNAITHGTNLSKILTMKSVDPRYTISNNIREVFSILGKEAARTLIVDEFIFFVSMADSDVNHKHIELLADFMMHREEISPVSYTGASKSGAGPSEKMSIERPYNTIVKAATHGVKEPVSSVTSSIIAGSKAKIGTGYVNLEYSDGYLERYERFSEMPINTQSVKSSIDSIEAAIGGSGFIEFKSSKIVVAPPQKEQYPVDFVISDESLDTPQTEPITISSALTALAEKFPDLDLSVGENIWKTVQITPLKHGFSRSSISDLPNLDNFVMPLLRFIPKNHPVDDPISVMEKLYNIM